MLVSFRCLQEGDLRAALTANAAGDLRWWRRGKPIALDVVRGLHFLHTHSVVHRDIKSKNILLAGNGRAKLGDVGLAQIMGRDVGGAGGGSDGETITEMVGTFAWMAPEVLLGDAISSKADMYG